METNSSLPRPPDPDAIRPWLGELTRERVEIGERTYWIDRPAKSDHLVNHPAVRSAFSADEYLPYWAELWPAARMLAKAIAQETWMPGTQAIEIGCGLGLPGVAALSAGLRVTFSDYDETALQFAAANAELNGFKDYRTLRLDWRSPPDGLQHPLVLGSDLTYELRHVEPLVRLVHKILLPEGLCLLTDLDRIPGLAMREAMGDLGLSFTAEVVRAGQPGGRRYKGTLYRVRHPSNPA